MKLLWKLPGESYPYRALQRSEVTATALRDVGGRLTVPSERFAVEHDNRDGTTMYRWRVMWRTARGTKDPREFWEEVDSFRRFTDAVADMCRREREMAIRLGGHVEQSK